MAGRMLDRSGADEKPAFGSTAENAESTKKEANDCVELGEGGLNLVANCNRSKIMDSIKSLCDQVRQTAYDVHVYHGQGHLEKVYENALVNRLRQAGLQVEQQFPIKVFDEDGTEIGDYLADLMVEGFLIVELKAAKTLAPEHEAQILGYLKSSRLEQACSSISVPIDSRSVNLHEGTPLLPEESPYPAHAAF